MWLFKFPSVDIVLYFTSKTELEGMQKDRIKRIESYNKDFKKITLGDLYFEKGESVLKLTTTKLNGGESIDFKLIVLESLL
jgi:hypothetical protein